MDVGPSNKANSWIAAAIGAVCLVSLTTTPASGETTYEKLQTCARLEECAELLGAFGPTGSDEFVPAKKLDEIADHFEKFGEPAKLALLKVIEGTDWGAVSYASEILRRWHGWTSSDVALLRTALQYAPGGWPATVLGRIASDEAIEILAQDLANGSPSESAFALVKLGDKAIPALTLALVDPKRRSTAEYAFGVMDSVSGATFDNWLKIALDQSQPSPNRVGAIRAVAMTTQGLELAERLRPLLGDKDTTVVAEAKRALVRLAPPKDPEAYMGLCIPADYDRQFYDVWAKPCLWEVEWTNPEARAEAQSVMPFLRSPDPFDQEAAITVLGFLDYAPAIPEITGLLKSNDWTVILAAVRSLGWMRATQAFPQLEQVAQHHWNPDVRKLAASVLLDFTRDSPSKPWGVSWREHSAQSLMIQSEIARFKSNQDILNCPTGKFAWRGHPIGWEPRNHRAIKRLSISNGTLVALDSGEFGGRLQWRPAKGLPVTLHADNAFALGELSDGAVAVFGLGHGNLNHGYIAWVATHPAVSPSVRKIGRLPGHPQAFGSIGQGVFAVWSGGLPVVFDGTQILGTAECVQ